MKRAEMAEYERKKVGTAESEESEIELKRDPSVVGEDQEEFSTKRNPDASQGSYNDPTRYG